MVSDGIVDLVSCYRAAARERKPDAAFYEYVLQQTGSDPSEMEIVFLDDKLENVEAAKRAGLYGVQFTKEVDAVAEIDKVFFGK